MSGFNLGVYKLMYKKLFIVLLAFCALELSACAQDKFSGGVSYDYQFSENIEAKNLKEKLPELKNDFIDLNYSIQFKPLNLLSIDEVVQKKKEHRLKVSPINPMGYTPDNYEISLATGKVKGNVNNAGSLELLLKKNPDDRELLFAYAIQLKNEKNLEQALFIVNKTLESDPNFALGHFLKGDILRTMERYKEAVEEYLYTAQINPYCADAYYNVAKILELLDNKELALDYYKTAYRANPNDLEIRDIILKHYIEL